MFLVLSGKNNPPAAPGKLALRAAARSVVTNLGFHCGASSCAHFSDNDSERLRIGFEVEVHLGSRRIVGLVRPVPQQPISSSFAALNLFFFSVCGSLKSDLRLPGELLFDLGGMDGALCPMDSSRAFGLTELQFRRTLY